jgi:hypothetical protein
MEEKKEVIFEFDDEIVSFQEYLKTMAEGEEDNPDVLLQIAQMNTQAKLLGKHSKPKRTFMEVIKLPYMDVIKNIGVFAKKQGLDIELPFLGNSQKI